MHFLLRDLPNLSRTWVSPHCRQAALCIWLTKKITVHYIGVYIYALQAGRKTTCLNLLLNSKAYPKQISPVFHLCRPGTCFYLRTQSIKAKHKTYTYSDFPPQINWCCSHFSASIPSPISVCDLWEHLFKISVQAMQSPYLQDDTKQYELLCLLH